MTTTRTRVHKRNRLLGNKHVGVYLNWRKLGPDGWRQIVPVPGSLSVHALGETWNPQRRTITTNLPGPVDTVTTYGRPRGAVTTKGGRLVEPELDAWAVEHVTCPRDTCQAPPGERCHRPGGEPCGVHMQRREMARTERHYGPDATAGGRSTRLGPLRPVGQLLARALGLVAVVVLAWLFVLSLGAHSALDVFRGEVGL